MKNISKYRGCIIGGAVGDALGYAVEFMPEDRIFGLYGENGISDYQLHNGKAIISDDTQMTLFTAAGLLGADQPNDDAYISAIADNYTDWYNTQSVPQDEALSEPYCSWLMTVPELYACRAPGLTCLAAIESGCSGSVSSPVNNSKGCGGIMRVAPVGLYFDAEDGDHTYACIQRIAAEASALTHGHPLGWLPSAMFAHIVSRLAHSEGISVRDAVLESLEAVRAVFADQPDLGYPAELIGKALYLADSDTPDLDAVHALGEGWVAEETLAIAVFCAVRYQDDFTKAICVSVNHKGDSDSTGAVTGNILGAYLGLQGIPRKYLDDLELVDVMTRVADDLYNDDDDAHSRYRLC